jgi:hypothetical protein
MLFLQLGSTVINFFMSGKAVRNRYINSSPFKHTKLTSSLLFLLDPGSRTTNGYNLIFQTKQIQLNSGYFVLDCNKYLRKLEQNGCDEQHITPARLPKSFSHHCKRRSNDRVKSCNYYTRRGTNGAN